MDSRLSLTYEKMKMKKITADQITLNINARLALLKKQGHHNSQLVELLNDICRHNHGIENIEVSTDNHRAAAH